MLKVRTEDNEESSREFRELEKFGVEIIKNLTLIHDLERNVEGIEIVNQFSNSLMTSSSY
jgi:hypothetical protein